MSTSTRMWWPFAAAGLVLLAGCAAEQSSAPSSPPPTSASAPAASTSASATPPPASPTPAAPPPASKPAGPPPSVPGSCGTITAASGLTLYVFDSSSAGIDCAAATKLVTDFQHKIAGRQGAGSNDAVNDTVDGWACTSGPPASQGGTTCSKGDQTVFAAVVPSE